MDLQAMFIAKTKRDGVWIRSVNAVNLDGERDKFISALGKCVDLESLEYVLFSKNRDVVITA